MVWAYFFGKKKEEQTPEKKETLNPQQKQKKQEEGAWLYEFLIQYLTSPVWKIPIYDFLDQHCIIFDDEEENKFEYTQIHKLFKDQIEAMVQQLMIDIGITEEQFCKMAEIGLKSKNHRKIFEQILIVDNFLVFKKLMVKRNKEMELEALKELEKIDKPNQTQGPSEVQKKELDKERSEVELAIAVSLAAQQETQKILDQEDEELQNALMQSSKLADEQSLSQSQSQEAESQALSQSKLDEAQRLKNIEKEKIAAQQKLQQEKQQQQQQQEEVTKQPAPQQVQQQIPQLPKEETKEQEPLRKQGSLIGDLPPIKAQKTLPALIMKPQYQKPVDDLLIQKKQLEDKLEDYKKAEDKIKNATVVTPEAAEKEAESMEERKKRLLKQREILRAKKQKQREEELKRFQELGQTDPSASQNQGQDLKKQQSIALDAEKKMTDSSVSEEEKKRRANLYSKILTDEN